MPEAARPIPFGGVLHGNTGRSRRLSSTGWRMVVGRWLRRQGLDLLFALQDLALKLRKWNGFPGRPGSNLV